MLLDTFAWIEYFSGAESGRIVEKILKKEQCHTSILSISEISVWCIKNNKNISERVGVIRSLSKILFINEDIATIGAKVNCDIKKTIKDFGMVDSLIYATAIYFGLKLVTGDPHFKNLENIIML